MGLRKVLEFLVILGNLEFYLLFKLGDNPSTNQIRIHSELRSYFVG